MRVTTRSGYPIKIDVKQIVKQEKRIAHSGVYYIVYLTNERQVQFKQAIPKVPFTVVDERVSSNDKEQGPIYTPPKTLAAEDCPSVITSFVAVKATDEHVHEKVKGETFYTHKSSSSTIIKSPKGDIIHDVNMKDTYRRRL
jgi:hypothetical protein